MIIIPTYNKQLVADGKLYLQSDEYNSSSDKIVLGEKVILFQTKYSQKRDELSEDNYYPIAVSGLISDIIQDGYIIVDIKNRVHIDEFCVDANHNINLTISKLSNSKEIDREDEEKRLQKLKEEAKELTSRFNYSTFFNAIIDKMTSIAELFASLSYWMQTTNEEKYDLICDDDASSRLDKMEKQIVEYIEVAKVTTDAASAQEKPQFATVVAVGPGGVVDGEKVEMYLNVGDKVIASKYAGTEVKIDGEEFTIVRQSDVLATVE